LKIPHHVGARERKRGIAGRGSMRGRKKGKGGRRNVLRFKQMRKTGRSFIMWRKHPKRDGHV